MFLPSLFTVAASASPDAIAVICDGMSLSYRELDNVSDNIADNLKKIGAKRGAIVGVSLHPSVHLAAAILGVLKSGAMYLPLDPGYPEERLSYMIKDAAPVCLLCDDAVADSYIEQYPEIKIVKSECIAKKSEKSVFDHKEAAAISGNDPAYVIYTSGSTGNPKGVVVAHRSLQNFLISIQSVFKLSPTDVIASATPYSFDIFGLELFSPLIAGASVHLIPREIATDGYRLVERIAEIKPSLMQGTPALWQLMREAGWQPDGHMKILCGGEAFPPDLAKFLNIVDGTVWNMYGPTETTIWSSIGVVDNVKPRPFIGLGKPLRNTSIFLLDENLEPVPEGADGEIYISGDGLAHGYFNRAALTAERFVACPYGLPGVRMYRTGDIGKADEEGNIHFLGRSDHQVKIRGFRIEPGEIEATLCMHAAVAQVCVLARDDSTGMKSLHAYVVTHRDAHITAQDIRAFLMQRLPGYMVPASFTFLPALPLTPNGKTDRKALSEITPVLPADQRPASHKEQIIIGLFCEILATDEIGPDSDFFLNGGNSLLATRFINRLRLQLGIECNVKTLFGAPTPALLADTPDLSVPVRPALSRFVRKESGKEIVKKKTPLSFAQQRLWFIQKMEGQNATYNLPLIFKLHGELNVPALRDAIESLVARHEVLRTQFPEQDGQPYQKILEATEVQLAFTVREVNQDDYPSVLQTDARYGFDLASELPVSVFLYRLSSQEHVLLILLHHIASDGWSLVPLIRDLGTCYNACLNGEPPELLPLPVQYADYTLWQREWLGDESDPDSPLCKQFQYWKERLNGAPECITLPYDYPRPAIASFQGDVVRFSLNSEITSRLTAIALSYQASLFMVLQAACAILFNKLGSGNDVVFGSPIAGRTDSALDDLIGFFVNTLVLRTELRTDTDGNPSFLALLKKIRKQNLDAYSNQDLPFDYLVEKMNPVRAASHHPLFQVMVVLQNNIQPEFHFSGLEVGLEPASTRTSKFDLTIEFSYTSREKGESALVCELEFATDLFKKETITRYGDYLQFILEQIVANPDLTLKDIALLRTQELRTILCDWSGYECYIPVAFQKPRYKSMNFPSGGVTRRCAGNTARPPRALPHEKCINFYSGFLKGDGYISQETWSVLFEKKAREFAGATAILYRDMSLTYDELNKRANQYARQLIASGVKPGDVVGVASATSPDMVAALIGILKLGAVYLPLDPSYPSDRLSLILSDADPGIVLTSVDELCLSGDGRKILDIREDNGLKNQVNSNLRDNERGRAIELHDPAYIIYTSGSTGTPKGVVVSHRGIPNLALAYIHHFRLAPGSRFLQFSSINFDPTFCELCCTLLSGATLILCSKDEFLSPDNQLAIVEQYQPTHITFSPTMLRSIPETALRTCTHLMVAGEACTIDIVRKWSPGRHMINAYGPTEATVDALYWRVPDNWTEDTVPIGRPLPEVKIYVLDEYLMPVVPGVPGELYISGQGLAAGYLNRPSLTAERFVACPYGAAGSRMYRTGDLVKWRHDGMVEFVGRTDNQIKIRGVRIEPGEIESVIAAHPEVAQVAVIVREDSPGNKYLAGYVVPLAVPSSARDITRDIAQEMACVSGWLDIHEDGYSQQDGLAVPEDFSGWDSTYTNKPIPVEEMLEWQRSTVHRIVRLRPERVLEVGVGSGLILWEVAPHVKSYYGVDFSASVIEALRTTTSMSEQIGQKIVLNSMAAHEINSLPYGSFDTIIINSVAQYFPGIDYLTEVITHAMALLVDGGCLFLGDIRNLRLHECFAADVARFKGFYSEQSGSDFRKTVERMMKLETELLIDPAWFSTLHEKIPALAGMDLEIKEGSSVNELTCFRYDVVLHKTGAELESLGEIPDVEWKTVGGDLSLLKSVLEEKQPDRLRVHHVPDARVSEKIQFSRNIMSVDSEVAIQPADIQRLAESLGYFVKLTLTDTPDSGYFDALFLRNDDLRFKYKDVFKPSFSAQHPVANVPLSAKSNRNLAEDLRRYLSDKLPDYMVPTSMTIVDALPLTPNGKLDVNQLPKPEIVSRKIRAPRSAREKLLAQIVAEVLGVEGVGLDDRFFDFGGDSVLSIQLVARARAAGLFITARDVFLHQSVGSILQATTETSGKPEEISANSNLLHYIDNVKQTFDPPLVQAAFHQGEHRYYVAGRLNSDVNLSGITNAMADRYRMDQKTMLIVAFALALHEWRKTTDVPLNPVFKFDCIDHRYFRTPIRLNLASFNFSSGCGKPLVLDRVIKTLKDQIKRIPEDARMEDDDALCNRSEVGLFIADQLQAGLYSLSLHLCLHNPCQIQYVPGIAENDIHRLENCLITVLKEFAVLSENEALGGATPADFDSVQLNQKSIDKIRSVYSGMVDILPLSPLQLGLYLHSVSNGHADDPYQSHSVFELRGALDISRLQASVHHVVRQHGNLTASFYHEQLEFPVQVITGHGDVAWQIAVISAESEINSIVTEWAGQRFDLSRGPLLRFLLIRISADEHRLVMADHHIILDGWSMGIFWDEVFSAYGGNRIENTGRSGMKDYLKWIASQNKDEAVSAWKAKLAGVTGVALAGKGQIANRNTSLYLSPQSSQRLHRQAAETGVTLNGLLQAVWAVLIAQLTGRCDILFGNTVTDRPEELRGIDHAIGLFINTVPVRATIDRSDTYASLALRMQEWRLALLPYSYLGLSDIQEISGGTELFDSYFVFQNFPRLYESMSVESAGLKVTEITNGAAGISHYPLGVTVLPGDSIELLIGYSELAFGAAEIKDILDKLKRILSEMEQGVDAVILFEENYEQLGQA